MEIRLIKQLVKKTSLLVAFSTAILLSGLLSPAFAHAAAVPGNNVPKKVDWTVSWNTVLTHTEVLSNAQCAKLFKNLTAEAQAKLGSCTVTRIHRTSKPYRILPSGNTSVLSPANSKEGSSLQPNSFINPVGGSCPNYTINHTNEFDYSTALGSYVYKMLTSWTWDGRCDTVALKYLRINTSSGGDYGLSTTDTGHYDINTGLPNPDINAYADAQVTLTLDGSPSTGTISLDSVGATYFGNVNDSRHCSASGGSICN